MPKVQCYCFELPLGSLFASKKMAKEVPASVKQYLRAVLISSSGGVLQTRIEQDYRKMTGEALNWKELGFRDLYEFLLAIPDVGSLEYSEKFGENKMYGKGDKEGFQSVHAKKAQNIPESSRPHRPPSQWPRNKNSNRVNPSGKGVVQVSKQVVANTDGLYSLRVSNIPAGAGEVGLYLKFNGLAKE